MEYYMITIWVVVVELINVSNYFGGKNDLHLFFPIIVFIRMVMLNLKP
jgi:hypothetical protein